MLKTSILKDVSQHVRDKVFAWMQLCSLLMLNICIVPVVGMDGWVGLVLSCYRVLVHSALVKGIDFSSGYLKLCVEDALNCI